MAPGKKGRGKEHGWLLGRKPGCVDDEINSVRTQR